MVSLYNYFNNYYFIDIKSGFSYNSDDAENINIGLKNNSNVKKRNINTDGVL